MHDNKLCLSNSLYCNLDFTFHASLPAILNIDCEFWETSTRNVKYKRTDDSHCGTNNRAPRWTFTDPCKPELRPGAREESASPAWLAGPRKGIYV